MYVTIPFKCMSATSLLYASSCISPDGRPAVPVEVRLVLGVQRAQQLRVLVAYVVVVRRQQRQAPLDQLLGVVHLENNEGNVKNGPNNTIKYTNLLLYQYRYFTETPRQ